MGLLVLGIVAVVYRFAARWGRLRGALTALVALLLLVVCWPLPIHGGFMLLGEVFVDEMLSMRERRHDELQTRRRDRFLAEQSERFGERLEFAPGVSLAAGWRAGRTRDGSPVWLDERSGLVWSDALELSIVQPQELLADARRACAEHPPRGQWALPTDAEGFHLWRDGGEAVLPHRHGRLVSQRVDTDFELALPIVRIVRTSDAARVGQQDEEPPWRVRCVALGASAPRRGYLDVDIPRDEWNAYQLAKTR
jgi:hypothetical protein